MRTVLLALAACAALGMGRRPPEKTMDEPKPAAATAWKGHSCGVSAPGARVVVDAAAWAALWKEAFGQEAPPADFSRQVAVAAFAGARNTGGWSVELGEAEPAPGGAVVRWRAKGPTPGAFVTMAFTAPYAVRLYDRPKGTLTTEERR